MPPAKRSPAGKRTAVKTAPRARTSTKPAKPSARAAATAKARAPRPHAVPPAAARDADVFDALVGIMKRQTRGMLVTQDGPGGLQVSLDRQFRGKPMWLGGVRRGKSYVSFHLMPVYMFPELLASISPALKRRMQGKSCFNFREPDPALLKELEALTKTGMARMKQDGPALLAKYDKK
jgi:hypothetical protein